MTTSTNVDFIHALDHEFMYIKQDGKSLVPSFYVTQHGPKNESPELTYQRWLAVSECKGSFPLSDITHKDIMMFRCHMMSDKIRNGIVGKPAILR